ncbi:MAG: M48 family metalloprotease [Syntrophaceae bacterium]|nr:M48 family metalloprotease [Syntrophaceae bacterium]
MGYLKEFRFKLISFLILVFLFEGILREASALTTEEEKKLGKQILLEMQGKMVMVRDLTIQKMIERVGYSIVDQVGPTPFEFKFFIINASDPNAFAIPGGYIFITTGLIALAENEQEIAAVLGHEISHVTARHVSQMIERAKRLNIASMVAILAAMVAGGGGAGSQAAATMAMATAEALTLKYTREMEVDADQNGLQVLIKAGYDPNGIITFLNKMIRMSLALAPKVPSYLSTHPAIEERLSLLENLLQITQRPSGPYRTIPYFKRVQIKAFVEEREPHVAVTHFQSFIDANPKDLDGYYGLGLAYRKMGRLDKSIEALQQAVSLAPHDLDLLRERGIGHFLSGKLDLAMEDLETVRSKGQPGAGQDDDLTTLYYLGRTYQERGELSKALPLFLRVKQEAPFFIDVYFNMASCYNRMDRKGLSHFYFGKYFKLKGDQKNATLHFGKAIEALPKGSPEWEEARSEMKELAPKK